MKSNVDLITTYAQKYDLYQSFTQICHNITKNYIDERGLKIHSINSRTKDIISIWGKFKKKDSQYNELNDISDLSGIRVITFFSDDVDTIGSIIEENFKVDFERSIDKRKMLAADRFGYLSLHYVCSLPEFRLKLSNYKKYKGLQFEIQIRSLLQHCWAEIEHDYGYKTEQEIPNEIRREFSRLAGLLEIADNEFSNIKKAAKDIDNRSKLLTASPGDVFIDADSMKWLINHECTINFLDEILAHLANVKIYDPDEEFILKRTEELQYVGLVTVFEIISEISLKAYKVINAFRARFIDANVMELPRGVSLHYLTQVIIAEGSDPAEAAKKMQHLGFGSYSSQYKWAKRLIQTMNNTEDRT